MKKKNNISITPMYEGWTFSHTGPKDLEIVYVTKPTPSTETAYILYKSKKPNQNK